MEERRVAVHRGDVDRQVEQQPLHHRRVVQDAVLERRERLDLLAVGAPPEPPLQRSERVAAEVEAIVLVDGLEQQLDLDSLEIVTRPRQLLDGHAYW
jgi:hypothetical protein